MRRAINLLLSIPIILIYFYIGWDNKKKMPYNRITNETRQFKVIAMGKASWRLEKPLVPLWAWFLTLFLNLCRFSLYAYLCPPLYTYTLIHFALLCACRVGAAYIRNEIFTRRLSDEYQRWKRCFEANSFEFLPSIYLGRFLEYCRYDISVFSVF